MRGLGSLAATLALLALLASGPARADSALELPYPSSFGTVPAATYDEEGRRVGNAHLLMEKTDAGHVRLRAESGIEGGERNVMTAELAPIEGNERLRLLQQDSRSFDGQGRPLGEMRIDHQVGRGFCEKPERDGGEVETLDLPDPDRVANVPVNLLFVPLVRGSKNEVDFQLMLCSGGPRLIKATASGAERTKTEDGVRDIVEVHYEMDFGSAIFSALAAPFVPQLSVWFDPDQPESWLAHRMPLFAKGPTVLVVRTGIPPGALNGHHD